MIPGRERWLCPVCNRPTGASGNGLSRHGAPCPGTGTDVYALVPYLPPEPKQPEPAEPEEVPPPWIPPVVPLDLAPFRRWRALGWTREQIAAVTGEGALW